LSAPGRPVRRRTQKKRATKVPSVAPALLTRALAAARKARDNAYAPYSGYRVGAALVTRQGAVYAGCNVENSTFGATLCAERSAVAAMIAAGDRAPRLCVLVTTGVGPAAPCGICRQVLAEFAPDLKLLLVAEDSSGNIAQRSSAHLSALLPHPFRLTPKKNAHPVARKTGRKHLP
jgi:cytidine deaminase